MNQENSSGEVLAQEEDSCTDDVRVKFSDQASPVAGIPSVASRRSPQVVASNFHILPGPMAARTVAS